MCRLCLMYIDLYWYTCHYYYVCYYIVCKINFNVNILSNFSKRNFPLIAKKAEISFLENKDSFTEKDWKNLYRLSEHTFVEESESLRQGAAGAGITDND